MLKKLFALATLFTATVFFTQIGVASEPEADSIPKIENVKVESNKKMKAKTQQKKTQMIKKQQQQKQQKKTAKKTKK